MKASTLEPHKAGTARLKHIPEPDPRDGSVLVEAIAVQMSTVEGQLLLHSKDIRLNDDVTLIEVRVEGR